MDTQWAFRQAYNTARIIKEKQDAYCARALAGKRAGLEDFPDHEDLQWELVDVLRGRVKVHNHCYEGVDFDGRIRTELSSSRRDVLYAAGYLLRSVLALSGFSLLSNGRTHRDGNKSRFSEGLRSLSRAQSRNS